MLPCRPEQRAGAWPAGDAPAPWAAPWVLARPEPTHGQQGVAWMAAHLVQHGAQLARLGVRFLPVSVKRRILHPARADGGKDQHRRRRRRKAGRLGPAAALGCRKGAR